MDFKITFISIFLIFLALGRVDANFKVTHLSLTADESVMNIKYELKEHEGQLMIDDETTLHQDLNGDLLVHGNISAIHPDGSQDRLYQILPLDFCKFLSNEKKTIILAMIWDQIKPFQHPQLPESCPIKAGTYGIKDYLPDTKLIPNIPAGKYRVEADCDHKEGESVKNIYRMLLDIEVFY